MTNSISPSQSGGPVHGWLQQRIARSRQADAAFDDPHGKHRRLLRQSWGTWLLVLVAAGSGVLGVQAFAFDLTLAMKALVPAMMVMSVILFMGTISRAHPNPAVSFDVILRGKATQAGAPAAQGILDEQNLTAQ